MEKEMSCGIFIIESHLIGHNGFMLIIFDCNFSFFFSFYLQLLPNAMLLILLLLCSLCNSCSAYVNFNVQNSAAAAYFIDFFYNNCKTSLFKVLKGLCDFAMKKLFTVNKSSHLSLAINYINRLFLSDYHSEMNFYEVKK